MQTMTRGARAARVLRSIGLVGALTLLLAGCAAGEAAAPPASDGAAEAAETSVPDSGASTSGDDFTAAFEAQGMDCAALEDDDLREGVEQQFVCRGGDDVIVTIRDYENPDARDRQLATIQDMACEIAETGQDVQRVAVSDTWLLMPGGDREADFALFGSAMADLGLQPTDYTC